MNCWMLELGLNLNNYLPKTMDSISFCVKHIGVREAFCVNLEDSWSPNATMLW
jgi:hypothetical protein